MNPADRLGEQRRDAHDFDPRVLLLGDAPRTNVVKPDYALAGRMARERLGL